MTFTPERRAQHQESMRQAANSSRDVADEIAARWGCDDPQHPWNFPGEFTSWKDFVDRCARPLVEASEANDEAAVQAALKLFRTVSPYSICIGAVMMDNRIHPPQRETT
jgi:hypothetical protein